MTTRNVFYGSYTAMTVTALQSLTTSSSVGWQSDRVSNISVKALDYELVIKLTTANTAPASDKAVHVYISRAVTTDGGTTWLQDDQGTTTLPSGTQGTSTIGANGGNMAFMGDLFYTTQNMTMQRSFLLSQGVGRYMPDGFSIIVINGTGSFVLYRLRSLLPRNHRDVYLIMFYPKDTWRKNSGSKLKFATGDPINTGCNGCFLFNDAPGTNPTDISTNNSVLTITFSSAGVTSAPTIFGRGYAFDGASNITTLPNTGIITTSLQTGGISVSAWVCPVASGMTGVMGKSVSGSDWPIFLDCESFSIVATNPSTAQFTASGNTVPANTWTHIAGVWNIGNYIAFYQNGRLIQKTSTTSNLLRSTIATLTIGRSVTGFFTGRMDNIRFWGNAPSGTGRALTDDDVLRLYEEPFAGIDTVHGDLELTLDGFGLGSPARRPVVYTAL